METTIYGIGLGFMSGAPKEPSRVWGFRVLGFRVRF